METDECPSRREGFIPRESLSRRAALGLTAAGVLGVTATACGGSGAAKAPERAAATSGVPATAGARTEQPETARLLGMRAHPEGGWYKETWRSGTSLRVEEYAGNRPTASAIYFLLSAGEESSWHTVRSPELWFWHRGGPLRLQLGGTGERPAARPTDVFLGPDLAGGQRPQVLVPAGSWQRARSVTDEEVLVSCVVSPGFQFEDFHLLPEAAAR
ncbi:cupin domain-containing protein [Streptomyces sp. NPDC026294]|uniref:cupin domain-containing protein n=1 Tax=Streptomyces sp. NPDC026294 TaxID=3155362 RepID=UPI00340111FE